MEPSAYKPAHLTTRLQHLGVSTIFEHLYYTAISKFVKKLSIKKYIAGDGT